VIEGAFPLHQGDCESITEGEESGYDLHPGTFGAVGGTLARGSRPLQTVCLLPQTLLPLEEGGVVPGVIPYEGRRLRGQRQVRRLFPLSTPEYPAEHTPGNPREGT